MIAGGDGNAPKLIKVEGKPPPTASIIQQTQSATAVKPIQPRIIQTANGQKVLIVQTGGTGGENPGVITLGGANSLIQTVVQPEPKKVIVKSISGNVVNLSGPKMVLSTDGSVLTTESSSGIRFSEIDQQAHKPSTTNGQMGTVLSAIASHVKNQKSLTAKTPNFVTEPQILSPQRVILAHSDVTSPSTSDNVVTEVFVQSSPPIHQVQSPPVKKIKLSPQREPTTFEVIQSGQSVVPTPLTVVKTISSHRVEDNSTPFPVIKTQPTKVETVPRVVDYPTPLTVVPSVSSNAEPVSRVVDYPVQLEDGTQVILQQVSLKLNNICAVLLIL